jgi:poly(A) polymerase
MARAKDPAAARAAATRIVRRLRDAGHVAFFAGGCVRDELLGLSPTDYDVATDATPARVRELFPRTAEVGAAFGVVLVKTDDAVVEVATFRSDGPYSDARRPDVVHFSDPRSDALRRDFTINALFLDPIAAADAPSIQGHVVDYVGGLADLRARVLRAVGDADQRLAEDHLRALRAVRFAARLGLRIDPATESAIRRHTQELRGVSRERIGDELRRMMAHPSRAAAVRLLQRLGLDAPVLDEPSMPDCALHTLEALSATAPTTTSVGTDAPGAGTTGATPSHDRPPGAAAALGAGEAPPTGAVQPGAAATGKERGGAGGEPHFAVCLAAWALDRHGPDGVGRDLALRWRRALNLSNEETDILTECLSGYLGLSGEGWLALPVARQKRTAAKDWFPAAVRLLEARDPEAAARVRSRVGELQRTPGGLSPPPLLTGDDLVAMGMRPGRSFKAILDGVYDAQLEGRVRDRAGAMELARSLGV